MKKSIYILFLLFSFVSFSQKKILKRVVLNTEEIHIYSSGLDNLLIENSNSEFVEVILNAESYDDQVVAVSENTNELNVKFHFEGTETREVIFRKFITKRLQRAFATIKIPKDKKVIVFGENVDIQSNNCLNELEIYIENGIIKLNEIQKNTIVKLYAGNVFASKNNTELELTSNLGKIKVDTILHEKEYFEKPKLIDNKLIIKSIKANIFLISN